MYEDTFLPLYIHFRITKFFKHNVFIITENHSFNIQGHTSGRKHWHTQLEKNISYI